MKKLKSFLSFWKHTIIFILFWIILCLTTKGQSNVTKLKKLNNGSIKTDSASEIKIDTSYAIILSKDELSWFISILKSQDEKPSIINKQIQAIYQKTQLILPPKKEEVKKK